MKISHLRHIVMIADKGSLRAAARELGLAQPAITRSVQEVEKALGAIIFERNARGAVATPVGERFVARAAAILAELERAHEEVHQLNTHAAGKVSIALSTASHIALLPKVLATFRKRYPNVALTIREALFHAVIHDFDRGALDFYIGPLPQAALNPNFCAELLFENRQVVICRKGHPLAKSRSMKELADADWVATMPTEGVDLGANFAGHQIDRSKIAVRADSSVTIILIVANSDLLAMPPQQWVNSGLASELLEQIPVQELLPAPSIFAIRRRHLPLTPPAQYLFDRLSQAGYNLQADD